MDNPQHNSLYSFSTESSNNATLPSVSAFSAYNSLLRNCNYLLSAPGSEINVAKTLSVKPSAVADCPTVPATQETMESEKFSTQKLFLPSPLFSYSPQPLHLLQNEQFGTSSLYSASFRRQRGEKKPIPEEQKDEKYFERRRRNNQAAKKSRDARKIREDQIALKATILEHENAILRAQVLTLKEETSSLRHMLLQKKALEMFSRNS